ncbi:hypothetical protein TGVAND_283698 [Toxoplasma gondii VAND]|uniref:Uncharacterized protein n=1 Tax=Toxoplasma gondii VAND TaxID=933077 RepID=A0A086Q669_TOXGO|nr:hypothetical protein TGVAND_283698 [Toxoplasma gondii VAND]
MGEDHDDVAQPPSSSFSSSSITLSSATSSASSSRTRSLCVSSLTRREEKRKAILQLLNTVSGLTGLTAETLTLKAVHSSLRFTCPCPRSSCSCSSPSASLCSRASSAVGPSRSFSSLSSPCGFSIFSCPHDSFEKRRRVSRDGRRGDTLTARSEGGARENESRRTPGRGSREANKEVQNDDVGEGRKPRELQGSNACCRRQNEPEAGKKPARALSGTALVDKAFGTVILPLLKKLFSTSADSAKSFASTSHQTSASDATRVGAGRGDEPRRKKCRRETEVEEAREDASETDEDEDLLLVNVATLRSLLRFVRDVLSGRIDREAPRGIFLAFVCFHFFLRDLFLTVGAPL